MLNGPQCQEYSYLQKEQLASHLTEIRTFCTSHGRAHVNQGKEWDVFSRFLFTPFPLVSLCDMECKAGDKLLCDN